MKTVVLTMSNQKPIKLRVVESGNGNGNESMMTSQPVRPTRPTDQTDKPTNQGKLQVTNPACCYTRGPHTTTVCASARCVRVQKVGMLPCRVGKPILPFFRFYPAW